MAEQASRLEELLDRVPTQEGERTSLDEILDVMGQRSFGPLLLVAGLVMLAPIVGDIPGVPIMMGLLVVLTAGQLLLRREHLWLPRWLLRRSVAPDKLEKVLSWLRPVLRFFDRLARPRLTRLTRGGGKYAIAVASTVVSLATPVMEIVPFSANVAGAAIVAFGVSLIAHDGLVALIAFGLTLGVALMIVIHGF